MTNLGLTGKKVLVTGGTRGIGRGIVLALAGSGADVITCYRQEGAAADSLERQLKETGGQHHVLRADIADPEQVAGLLSDCGERFGRLDVVVNNAAMISHVPYADLTLAQWQETVNTNLTGVHLVIQHALPLLVTGSSVISISTKTTEVGLPLCAPYTATKAALHGLTRTLAKEFGLRQIRFNVLSLGMIHTEALDAKPAEQRDQMIKKYSEIVALGRFGEPDEVAGAVQWLASDLSRYVTGAVIPVDGGIA